VQIAANHLVTGAYGVAEIAERVGDESEAVFSPAFKKVVGASLSHWRRRRSGNGVGRVEPL
jgi:AraC-like DNA-binding protein